MKSIVDNAIIQLEGKKNVLVSHVQKTCSGYIFPDNIQSISVSSTNTASNNGAKAIIGIGALLSILGITTFQHKFFPIILGLSGVVYGVSKMKSNDLNITHTSSAEITTSEIVSELNQMYNDLYAKVGESWDTALGKIKLEISSQLDCMTLENDERAHINDVIRSRSVIDISTLYLFNELNNAGKTGNVNELKANLANTCKYFVNAIEKAFNEQVESYRKLIR